MFWLHHLNWSFWLHPVLLTGGLQSAIKAASCYKSDHIWTVEVSKLSHGQTALDCCKLYCSAVCSMVLHFSTSLVINLFWMPLTIGWDRSIKMILWKWAGIKSARTKPRNTNKIQALMATLNGASRIRGKLKSRRFSAILQTNRSEKGIHAYTCIWQRIYTHMHQWQTYIER